MHSLLAYLLFSVSLPTSAVVLPPRGSRQLAPTPIAHTVVRTAFFFLCLNSILQGVPSPTDAGVQLLPWEPQEEIAGGLGAVRAVLLPAPPQQ